MKRIFRLSIICLMLLLNVNFAFADRRILLPPPIFVYNAAKYLNDKYLDSINELSALLKKHGDSKAIDVANSLRKTNHKKEALIIIEELEMKFQRSRLSSIISRINETKMMVSSGSFNNHATGVGLSVDNLHKEYVFSWDEGGKHIVKKVPMVPKMNVRIKASYITSKSNKNIYVYEVDSHISSKSSFYSLYLENKFTQSEINLNVKKIGSKNPKVSKSSSIKQDILYPGGQANYFEIFNYNYNNDKLVKYKPGVRMDFPYELESLENSLPGLVETSIGIHFTDYNPSSIISSDESPEIAVEIIGELLSGPHANRYWGRTIGPVPAPNPFNKEKHIEKVITYFSISTEEGWIDNKEVIDSLRSTLQKIKTDLGNKQQIKELIDSIETYYNKEAMLSEAYTLLKYNLEYLLNKQ